ncbi:uncharacterized protein LOC133814945 [Humulus lupulus]|uniref:uncharacterized protein LOC133814945 n=1 Tax=Humulus lupulus TaxID=3486 RepID=UPI002B4104BA|nr:uncharacterized protein LOC133814945 [Humulus lupulus]
MVQQMPLGQQVRPCGICQLVGHPTDACPTLQKVQIEQVNAIGEFPWQPRKQYDTYSSTYNEGWRDHPNIRYGNQQQAAPTRPPRFNSQQRPQQAYVPCQQQPPTGVAQDQEPSISNMLKTLVPSNIQTQVILQKRNPIANVSVITLQSGIQYEPLTQPLSTALVQKQVVDNSIHDEPSTQKTSHKPTMPTYVPRLHFPIRLKKFKKEEADNEILEIFRKIEANIPLLDAIKQVPHYAKFFKELCTNKRKLKDDEKISVGENVSTVLQKKLPPKCKDP